MRKTLSIVLVIVMLVGLMTSAVFATDYNTYEADVAEDTETYAPPIEEYEEYETYKEYAAYEEYEATEAYGDYEEYEANEYVQVQPFAYTVVASGTMNDFPTTNVSTRAYGTAAGRMEERLAPEHDILTYSRTLFIGEPGVTGTLNRPGALFPNAATQSPWHNHRVIQVSEITRIVFEGPVVAGDNLFGLFNDLRFVESIENIHYLDTSATVSMASLFRNLGNIGDAVPTRFTIQLDLSSWDTSNVTSMQNLFSFAPIDYLNLSGWDTSNVTNMDSMFQGVHYLENLDVSHFDTSQVTTMRAMFSAFSSNSLANPQNLRRNSFRHLDLSNFDTSNVTTMDMMFYGSANITHLDLSNFDTSSLDPSSGLVMHRMFQGMHSLVELDISGFETAHLHQDAMLRMFINNYVWDGRDNPTAAQNHPNIQILHLGPNFRFRASGTGILPGLNAGHRSFVPNVPGSSNPADNTQWMGQWVQVENGTVDRPAGDVFRTSAQLMNMNSQTPGAGTWVWRPRIYTINFDANQGTGTMEPGAPRHPAFNESYTLANSTFTREGYTFTGWNTVADGTGIAFADGYTFAPWNQLSDMTLFAQWSADAQDYTVTFNLHGGTGNFPPQTVPHGNLVTEPATNPTRQGYTFAGWFTAPTGGAAFDFTAPITGDTVVHARWNRVGGNLPGNGGGTQTPPPPPPPPSDDDDEIKSEHQAFLVGFEDGLVRPHGITTRAQAATIFFRLITDANREHYWMQTNPFPDVVLANWFNNAISTMTNAGVFMGMPNGMFEPNRAVTRAELAAMIVRFMGAAPHNGSVMFIDVAGHWAEGYINAAAINGWVMGDAGVGGQFRPNAPITRAETAAMINRILGRLPEHPSDLLDDMIVWADNANPDAWYYLYIQEATNSHYYVRKADGIHESWKQILEPRLWALLERPDSRPQDIIR